MEVKPDACALLPNPRAGDVVLALTDCLHAPALQRNEVMEQQSQRERLAYVQKIVEERERVEGGLRAHIESLKKQLQVTSRVKLGMINRENAY